MGWALHGSKTRCGRPSLAGWAMPRGRGLSPHRSRYANTCSSLRHHRALRRQKADSQVERPANCLRRQAVGGQWLAFGAGRGPWDAGCVRAWCRAGGPGTGVAGYGVARLCGCIRAVVVPPGASPIRGRPPRLQGTAVLMRLLDAGRDGRPRAWAGERGYRHRPAAATSACRRSGNRLKRATAARQQPDAASTPRRIAVLHAAPGQGMTTATCPRPKPAALAGRAVRSPSRVGPGWPAAAAPGSRISSSPPIRFKTSGSVQPLPSGRRR